MIELTVKTLDAQNHQFTVDDNITVEQFKVKIADTVNIPAETQRIIYCGRVLQDSSKLADYDVNGKVVHLVERPPPGTNSQPSSRSDSPRPQRRTFRGFGGFDGANAMHLASVLIPGGIMESQGIAVPPPTHSLSSSRLMVARRMLRRAETVLNLLENPNVRPQDANTGEENQDDELTTTIEARILVPNPENMPLNEDDVINVVQNSLFDSSRSLFRSGSESSPNVDMQSPDRSRTATPVRTGTSSTSQDTSNAAPTSNALPGNASPTSEMAELLTTLGQLQTRFAPFLERYHRFMQEDPEVPAEDQRQTQAMLNRVSEVLHLFGHAYHSLSDILLRVRTQPPRPLMCRPIVLQQSALVQTGFPIQVEVTSQINLPADRQAPDFPGQESTSATSNSATSETRPATDGTGAAATTNTAASAPATQPEGPPISVQPGFVGLNFLPGAAMRVQSFPLDFRTVRPTSSPQTTQNHNPANTTEANSAAASTAPSAPVPPPTTTTSTTTEAGQNPMFNLNNPNVEFFMEVTPEVFRGALNGPPPEFLQSIMQMARQFMTRNLATGASTTTPSSTAPSTDGSTPRTESATTTGAQATATSAGQNSQARGNTQTNPTTATQTRSSSRPHAHASQQMLPGGFDPFLPCNSHHISRRNRWSASGEGNENAQRHIHLSRNDASRPNTSNTERRRRNTSNREIADFMSSLFDNFSPGRSRSRNFMREQGEQIWERELQYSFPILGALVSGIVGRSTPRDGRVPVTVGALMQNAQEDASYVFGESLLNDIQMFLLSHLTVIDLIQLAGGTIAPIARISPQIRDFARSRICDGNWSSSGITRAVDNLLIEIRPILQCFEAMPCANDISIVGSAEALLRSRLQLVLSAAVQMGNFHRTQLFTVQCIELVKDIFRLLLYGVRNLGQDGIERIVDYILSRILLLIPPHNPFAYPSCAIRSQLRDFLNGLTFAEQNLLPFIVRRLQAGSSLVENGFTNDGINNTDLDSMDVDDQTASSSSTLGSPMFGTDDVEPVGGDLWRNQPEGWLHPRQRRQNPPMPPASDGYVSSNPSKRRKLVNNSKPQDSLPQIISDSVRQAVIATGLAGVAPLETVAEQAGSSIEIQGAYRTLLRSTVEASLQDNEDFVPEKFPNVANYFKKDHQ